VNEAIETSDAGGNSVANHPKEPGAKRVREEGEMGEAQAMVVELQWREGEALLKQMQRLGGAKPQHSLAEASSSWWILDTALEEDRNGNGTREPHRQCAQSRCAQVCALARKADDQLGSVLCHRVAAENRSQQILW